ncbi:hypothetical protein, partial [Citrobacter cronae]
QEMFEEADMWLVLD